MADATVLAFWASMLISVCGTIVALGAAANGEYRCKVAPMLNLLVGAGSSCTTLLSLSWTLIALQAAFLVGIAVCAATKTIHAYRSTLWSAGAVTVCVAVREANQGYTLLPMLALADGSSYDGMVAFIVGASLFLSGNVLLAFTGDAMYRAKRLEGRDGFVTFRRVASRAAQQPAQEADEKKGVEEEEGADGVPVASKAGLAGWIFLASLVLSVAGTFVVLGGVGALQQYCSANGTVGRESIVSFLRPCNRDLSLYWVVWALQFCFLLAVGLCYKLKQVHNYRASLWSVAGVVTGVTSYVVYWLVYDYPQGSSRGPSAAWNAALAGFCIVTLSNMGLIVSGDHMYRLRREEGADGFVSMRRPGTGTQPAQAALTSVRPRRLIEWAFVLSFALALAGAIVALGALAAAQSSCSSETLTWRGRGDRCARFFSYMWFAMALELLVLAGTAAAWATSYVHSFKASLWSLATVVTFACIVSANYAYSTWGFSTGATHAGLVACLYGFAIVVSGNYLMMATGDALHQLRREENAAGFVTFRRPRLPTKPAAGAAQV